MKLIKHPGIIEAKEWAPLLKGKDLKHGVRNVLQFLNDSDFAEQNFPLSNNPKISVRAPVGETIALAWFDLTRNDTRIGFDFSAYADAYEDRLCKGLKKDDNGCDLVGSNINKKLSTGQVKLISDPRHPYATGPWALEERQKLDSFITESHNIFSANDVVVKEGQKDFQMVIWMTCQPIPAFTADEKLRGKLLQCCFGKTNYKKGIINVNDFTHSRFMNDMVDLIMASAEAT
jgi:hypothetical protein